MIKRFSFLSVIVFFCHLSTVYAQLNIRKIDPGPYTPGSSIAAIFDIGSNNIDRNCIQQGNRFDLHLISPTGTDIVIGNYNGFYSTFVNGRIPNNILPGTGYRLQIRSTSPVIISNESVPFEIRAGSPVTAALSSIKKISDNPLTFGNCNSDPTPALFNFTNTSTSADVEATFSNELTPTDPQVTLSYAAQNTTQPFTAKQAHYTIFVKARNPDNTVGTYAYFLINNAAVTAFSTRGGNTVCYPTGTFQYWVDVSESGIKGNFPGNTYRINWGDGTTDTYTLCDILSNDNKVIHSFSRSSCGNSFSTGTITEYNAFGVNVQLINPFCGNVGTAISTIARVVTRPVNRFSHLPIVCVNDNVVFRNESTRGQKPNADSNFCSENEVYYTWSVNDVPIAIDKPYNYDFQYRFPSKGIYRITLTSTSMGSCQADPVEQTICVQDPPKPGFTLPTNLICLTPGTLTPVNTTILDNTCPSTPIYTWRVTTAAGVPATGFRYIGGTSAGSATPQFQFTQIGIYNITLSVRTATCEATTAPQRVVVNSEPVATLSPRADLCVKGSFIFGPSGTVTRTDISGTADELADTYTWEVIGVGAYNFVAPSTANSKYPTINFADYGSYTVKLTYKNNCNTITKTQVITFSESPVPSILATPPTICYDGIINLQGAITNRTPTTTFRWVGGVGGVFSNPTGLTTTYTPTAAERTAGSANIRLEVNTGLTGTCAQVVANTSVIIYPNNISTNPIASRSQQICTNTAAVFIPSAVIPGSTFTWTAVNADGRATLPATSGTGDINQIIVNTSQTQDAVIVYTITPSANGCTGVPFTFTVTVNPKAAVSATVPKPTICSGEPAGIVLTPTLAGTKYTWTSVATAGITGNTNQTLASTSITDVLVNAGTVSGTVTYKITPVSVNGCPGDEITVVIDVDPAVTIASAGNNASICNTTTYTLNGNVPKTNETGTWTLASGQNGVSFSNPNSPNAEARGLVDGQVYRFTWTITAPGVCNPSSATVEITLNPPTIPGTLTADKLTVCYGVNSGLITLSGQLGTILHWQSSTNGTQWTDILTTTTSLTFSNLLVTTQYRVVVANGSCTEKASDPITIIVNPPITVATAGPDQNLCNERTITLAGNAADGTKGESGRWTMIQGDPNAVITDPTNPRTTVTGLIPGTYKFRWTINGAVICDPTFDEVVINNLPPIVNTIGNPVTVVCYGQTINITSTVLSGGNNSYTYVWESSPDGTNWTVISGKTDKDLSFVLLETLRFRRTVNSGACSSTSNIITVNALPPIANNTITAPQTICEGIRPAKLEGSTPTGGGGTSYTFKWQQSTDNGSSWTDIPGTNFKDYEPPVLQTTTLYRRLVSTVECSGALQSESASVKIQVNPNAKAVFTYATDKGCIPFVITAQNIQATPFPEGNATYTWYANDVRIGTGITFPGYTIATSNERVVIKLVTTALAGCKEDEMEHAFSTNQDVGASFTQSAAAGCGPLRVNFVNTSSSLTNATFSWDFGNGTTSTQTMPPAVTFLPDPSGDDITYTVTLTATTTCGVSTFSADVLVKAKPKAVFSPDKVTGCSPMKVIFSNTSRGTNNTYVFDFGDGSPTLTKTDNQPVEHTYNTTITQDFTVKMVATNECGTDEQSFVIRVAPNTITPELVVNANEKEGCAPFRVNFYNNSRGASSYHYDFGDGSSLQTRTAPETVQHTFMRPGTYVVVLTASNGCSTVTTSETITVLEQPVIAFSADKNIGCPGLSVKFTNTTTGALTYLWDFGDGNTSTEFEPVHTYTGPATFYTVTLTAINSLGCPQTLIKSNFINVVQPPVAQFSVRPGIEISIPNYTFNFIDESTNSPDKWEWDFGDGSKSSLKSPNHTYQDVGTFKVTLRVTNQQGCTSETFKMVTITGVPGYLAIPNSFIPGSEIQELRKFSAKGTGIKSWRFSVFNKWGEVMWETTKLDDGKPVEGWDGTFRGTEMPQGVYYWKVEVQMINGSAWKGMSYGSGSPKTTGPIHLIR